jgi:hypothetical protein
MLAIIVLGMGIDYALFTIRSFQRYGSETDPELALFRTTVFLAATSTLVGFGALMSAEHAVFKSAGLTSFGGILFSVVGTFVLLPPLLRRVFDRPVASDADLPRDPVRVRRAARRRFRHFEIRPRWAAWHKLREDGLLAALPLPQGAVGSALVYPVGYGIEAAWLAEAAPGVRLWGADPDAEKVRVATRVADPGGCIRTGAIDALQDEKDITILFLTGQPPRSTAPESLLRAAGGHLAIWGALIVLTRTGDAPASWISRLWDRVISYPEPFDEKDVQRFLKREGYEHIVENRAGRRSSLVWLRAVKT